MSLLTVFADNEPSRPEATHDSFEEIEGALRPHGIRFERWDATQAIDASSEQGAILSAYGADVERLKKENGFQTADVISLGPDNPKKDEMRQKFLSEHTHSEDEVRFFVRGNGLFYLHVGSKVLALLCEKGDLISVPAGTRHWFDMGPDPDFTCIRLFTNPEGWVASYREDSIADQFPRYEALTQ